MTHLITISIIYVIIYIPYAIGRYLIFREKPDDYEDCIGYWCGGFIIALAIFLLVYGYIFIYQIL